MTSITGSPDGSGGAVLVTGATGFLGIATMAKILDETDCDVVALVRAASQEEADARLENALVQVYGPQREVMSRVRAVRGDVEHDGLLISDEERRRLAAEVTTILHGAAVIAFNLPEEVLRETNYEGTRRVLELARYIADEGRLDRFVHVSSAFVGGHMDGTFREDQLDPGASFRNSYEESKAMAEMLVHEAADDGLPVAIARPSVISGDSKSGWTTSWHGISMPLRMFSIGAVQVIPAARTALVDTVPVDWVTDGLLALLRGYGSSERCPTYHLVAGERAATIVDLVEMSAEVMGCDPVNVVDPEVFWNDIFPAVQENDGSTLRFMEAAKTYLPYFDVRVRFDAGRGPELAGSEPPRLNEYFERIVAYAQKAKWGKRGLPLVQARALFGDMQPTLAMA